MVFGFFQVGDGFFGQGEGVKKVGVEEGFLVVNGGVGDVGYW